MKLFGERTRLPGASAYNSIAVVQKWEHFEPDPLQEIEKTCERLREQLQGKVAEVIPTSGLLANTARAVPIQTWAAIARLAAASTPGAVHYLLRTPAFFCKDKADIALDAGTRTVLYRSMEWPALRFVIGLALRRKLDDGVALRQAVLDASGIDWLTAVLQDRFFSLAGLIKANTVLGKAWTPCDVALLRLQQGAYQCSQALTLGQRSVEVLHTLTPQYARLAPVLEYVNQSLSSVSNDLKQMEYLRGELDAIRSQAARAFEVLDQDITCLRTLSD